MDHWKHSNNLNIKIEGKNMTTVMKITRPQMSIWKHFAIIESWVERVIVTWTVKQKT